MTAFAFVWTNGKIDAPREFENEDAAWAASCDVMAARDKELRDAYRAATSGAEKAWRDYIHAPTIEEMETEVNGKTVRLLR